MGTLRYGSGLDTLTIPDDVLAHVKIVITTKLRRGESFTFTWRHPEGEGPARTTLWIQPAIPLLFTFDSDEPVTLDRDYLQELAVAANSNAGLVVISPEPRRQTRQPVREPAAA
ncbi:hypothetical protein J2Y46_004160 [Microbacterium sp. BE35]|uniref:DUF7882 family protein n=1 Tax=Microbacterium sp. BE35 TaxID=2817773 RepID=UPI002858FA89|nr:hypothetical protein [Microbacterium sp. BE35]MDR7191294.1 hypothetical protein [Microbacterium sp. BE35]